MAVDGACENGLLQNLLSGLGFSFLREEITGYIFLRAADDTCLIIDTVICSLKNYPYIDYTSDQNELMADHCRVFRFLLDDQLSVTELEREIALILSDENDPEKIHRFGGNRSEQQPDPTMPEAAFEECFLEAFGASAGIALHREFAYIDLAGTTRYIDYALFAKNGKFAIELNGESFHHPVATGPARYSSQLFKQNSLVADGFKVFRWSLNGMRDRERFILELDRFFGAAQPFLDKSVIKLKRQVESFELKEHQKDALGDLDNARMQGRHAFLLVMPTATGKTEVFIEDIARLKLAQPKLRALIIVPTRNLRDQTLARLRLRLPLDLKEQITDDIFDDRDLLVQTTAYMHRHYYKLAADRFDYIVVDEAHHAPAQGLRNILEHFSPTHLIGVTATPDRLDLQRLEGIFGEYEPQLSLEEAIVQGLVTPVRCYRVKTNIDLSEVRFNGKEYVKNDLQRTLLVPSRDELIADVVDLYFSGEFSGKQGIVFCVDIRHARRMADLFNAQGIPAAAVDGKERKKAEKALTGYESGAIRFLCACDLLTEGWDAPQTEILVMARPTFSRVLYTQQLGRGLRKHPGKEALYVIDVVDNYGGRLQPLSLHALFRIPSYQPFGDLIKPDVGSEDEIIVLDGLYEGERRIEPVDIFSFEETYGAYLNEEQLARELFVSTGTVNQWLKTGRIKADAEYAFGRKKLSFFHPDQAERIRMEQGLKEHTAETRVEDFREFLEKRDYTFSYKIIFLLAFLKVANLRKEAALPELLELYQRFYRNILTKHGSNERTNCPYNRADYLDDENLVQRSLLENPFEKFERKRFFYHCKDLNYLALDPELVKKLSSEDYKIITTQMVEDLREYYAKLEIELRDSDFEFLLPEKEVAPGTVQFIDSPADEEKYKTVLPYFPLSIAAGSFLESATPEESETWFSVDGLTRRGRLSEDMFVAQVHGRSMEPVIPDGAYCLFSLRLGGSRNGRIVLARKANIDPDTGAGFTVKTYHSSKVEDPDSGWRHETITLCPANPEYETISIPAVDAEDFRIVAFFEEVLND